MQGYAWRCDWCNSVQFEELPPGVATRVSSLDIPKTWIRIGFGGVKLEDRHDYTEAVPYELAAFCSWECVHYYVSDKLGYAHD